MNNDKAAIFLVFFGLMAVLLSASSVHAQSELPYGIQKIVEYNNESSADFALKISFFIAFIAGMTSILSPCILPLLPAYFAITFREKRNITLATSIFFLGFASTFIFMGLLATLLGNSLNTLFKDMDWVVMLAGLFLIILGIMIFLGKSFGGFLVKKRFGSDPIGVLSAGAAFAIGWTACTGPILSGTLLMASTMKNYTTSSYLMFSYSLGIFVPLFIFSFFYDRIRLNEIIGAGRGIDVKIMGKTYRTNRLNMIAGTLFAAMGVIFIVFRGTSIFNKGTMFGLKDYFYSLQRMFIADPAYFNIVGVVAFIVFAAMFVYFLRKDIKNRGYI